MKLKATFFTTAALVCFAAGHVANASPITVSFTDSNLVSGVLSDRAYMQDDTSLTASFTFDLSTATTPVSNSSTIWYETAATSVWSWSAGPFSATGTAPLLIKLHLDSSPDQLGNLFQIQTDDGSGTTELSMSMEGLGDLTSLNFPDALNPRLWDQTGSTANLAGQTIGDWIQLNSISISGQQTARVDEPAPALLLGFGLIAFGLWTSRSRSISPWRFKSWPG